MDFFADHTPGVSPPAPVPAIAPWCVLLVDDEPQVHEVTRLALRGFEFQQRGLELLSAYSAAEARAVFAQRDDIALALIDVVMETEHAGLDLVRYLRGLNHTYPVLPPQPRGEAAPAAASAPASAASSADGKAS